MISVLASFSLKTFSFSSKSKKKSGTTTRKIPAGWREPFLLCLFVWVSHVDDYSAVMWHKKQKNQHKSLYKSGGKKKSELLPPDEDHHGWSSANLLLDPSWFIHYFLEIILPDTPPAHTPILLRSYKKKNLRVYLKNEPRTKYRCWILRQKRWVETLSIAWPQQKPSNRILILNL